MKAIKTTYHGPRDSATRTRGPRYSATDGDGNRVSVPESIEQQRHEDGHDLAARTLIQRMRWFGTWYRGDLVRAGHHDGCIYVPVDDRPQFTNRLDVQEPAQ